MRRSLQTLEPKQVLAAVLAHESKHLEQGVAHYGWKTPIVFGVYVAIPLLIPTLVLVMKHSIAWWWLPLVVSYYLIALLTYWHDHREQEARHHAAEHWQEWSQYVSVNELK